MRLAEYTHRVRVSPSADSLDRRVKAAFDSLRLLDLLTNPNGRYPLHHLTGFESAMPLDVEHRPYAKPSLPWALFMRWEDLLFAHWPVKPQQLRSLLPEGLELDTFSGEAWVSVVPFRMSGIRGRCLPRFPGASAFPELNLRTYVTVGGKPGVWFFSLDAAHRLAVRVARQTFGLPYFDAAMSCRCVGETVAYESRRTHRNAEAAEYRGSYQPTGPVYRSKPGELDHWLTERYCLYAASHGGRVRRGDIHHQPWPLQVAEAEFETLAMTQQIGLVLPDTAPLLHFAKTLDVVAWLPTGRLS